MDVRLTAEQQQLRDVAAKLADDLGPASVQALEDDGRIARLDKQIEVAGWRSLRSDGASGVEVAIVAEEFGRGLVDAPFLGPVLAGDLARQVGIDGAGAGDHIGRSGGNLPENQSFQTEDFRAVLAKLTAGETDLTRGDQLPPICVALRLATPTLRQ